MGERIKASLVVLCIVILTSVGWAGHASAQKKVFKMGSIYGYTGIVATVQVQLSEGLIDYIKYFNETGGADLHPGLKGITIDHLSVDSGYTVPGYLKQFWNLVQSGHRFIYSIDSQGGDAVKSHAEKEQVPIVTGALTDRQMFPPGWIFGSGVAYPEPFGAIVDWARAQKKTGPFRFVWLTTDNPFGRAPIEKCTAYAKKHGVEVFGPVFIPKVPVDVTAELKTAVSYNPDYIMMNLSEAEPSVMSNVQRLGIHKQNIKFVNYWASEEAMQVAPEACEMALYHNLPWGLVGENSPGMRLFDKLCQRYRGKQMGVWYICGMFNGRTMLGALEKALEKVSFDKLNGENIKRQGLERMKNYDMLGIGPNLTFTPNDRRGVKETRVIEIKGGKYVAKTGYIPCPDME